MIRCTCKRQVWLLDITKKHVLGSINVILPGNIHDDLCKMHNLQLFIVTDRCYACKCMLHHECFTYMCGIVCLYRFLSCVFFMMWIWCKSTESQLSYSLVWLQMRTNSEMKISSVIQRFCRLKKKWVKISTNIGILISK